MSPSDPVRSARLAFTAAKIDALEASQRARRSDSHIAEMLNVLGEADRWAEAGDAARKLKAAFEQVGRMADQEPRRVPRLVEEIDGGGEDGEVT